MNTATETVTLEQYFVNRLVENGLWEKEAKAVMEVCKTNDSYGLDAMKNRWEDDEHGYAAPIKNVTWLTVKTAASDWLKENKPKHWARSIFDGSLNQ